MSKTFYNFISCVNNIVDNPQFMIESQARQYVPQTPRAQRLFGLYHIVNKLNYEQTILAVNKIIFERAANNEHPDRV